MYGRRPYFGRHYFGRPFHYGLGPFIGGLAVGSLLTPPYRPYPYYPYYY